MGLEGLHVWKDGGNHCSKMKSLAQHHPVTTDLTDMTIEIATSAFALYALPALGLHRNMRWALSAQS